MLCPLKKIDPLSASSNPAIKRKSVVFPLPLGPRSAKKVPPGISNESLSKTRSPSL